MHEKGKKQFSLMLPDRESALRVGDAVLTVALMAVCVLLSWEYHFDSVGTVRTVGIAVFGCCIAALVLYSQKSLWRKPSLWLWLLFFGWTLVSGFAHRLPASRVLFSMNSGLWYMMILSFLAMVVVRKPKALLITMAQTMQIFLVFLTLAIWYFAFHGMPGTDLDWYAPFWGCFAEDRLTGFGNSNIMGQAATTLVFLGGFLTVTSGGWLERVLWSLTVGLGLVTLIFTNSRTCLLAVAVFAIIIAFDLTERWLSRKLPRWLAILLTLLSFFALLALGWFCLVKLISALLSLELQEGDGLIRSLMFRFVQSLAIHNLTDIDFAFENRMIIWKAFLYFVSTTKKECWLGISGAFVGKNLLVVLMPDGIWITADHVHNTVLELWRIYGLPAVVIMLAQTVRWLWLALKRFFTLSSKPWERYLMAVLLAVLVLGVAECPPFPSDRGCFVNIFFFAICGYFDRLDKTQPDIS